MMHWKPADDLKALLIHRQGASARYSSLPRRPFHQAQLTALFGTKINSSDPTLTSVFASDTPKPLAPLFHPPVERAAGRPRCCLHFDGRVHFSAIGFGIPSRVEVLHNLIRTQIRF
jgi:hypothetical protein